MFCYIFSTHCDFWCTWKFINFFVFYSNPTSGLMFCNWYYMVVLVCLGCYNRKPKIVWHIYNADLFFLQFWRSKLKNKTQYLVKICFWVHSLYLVGVERQISKVPFIGAQTPFMWAPFSWLIFPKCTPPNIVWLWGLSFSMWLLGDTNTNSVGRSLENLVTWWPANTTRGSTLVIWPFDCFWLLIEGGMFWQLWGILKL